MGPLRLSHSITYPKAVTFTFTYNNTIHKPPSFFVHLADSQNLLLPITNSTVQKTVLYFERVLCSCSYSYSDAHDSLDLESLVGGQTIL